MTKSLGDSIQEEIKRVSALRDEYLLIPTGFIGASMMEISIDKAVKALADGDVIEIMQAFEDLKGFTG